ncbi:MAG: dihydrofolate synthase/folylpolyglutamate synthase [Rickettsiales bacterium]|jgi:dihydrofolate synthase/folylpolyglutamate synthase
MKFPSWPEPAGHRDVKLGLSRVNELLGRLGNPHKQLPPTIHIAGTNGKGSTQAFLRAIFEDADLKVHSYVSPHLVRFNERIILANKEIEDDFLNEILEECKKASQIDPQINVTFFEGITVAAFLAFSRIKADILILETGMGGRLDATNVVDKPFFSIITPVSLDHMEFLGNTLPKIAFEKAGIIKEGCRTIVSKQHSSVLKVIEEVAESKNSKIISFENIHHSCVGRRKLNLSLQGDHQIINAKTAIATVLHQNLFKISSKNITNGLKKAVWQARLQRVTTGKFSKNMPKQCQLFLDGAHNKAGARSISEWLTNSKRTKNYVIFGMLADKDLAGFLKIIAKQTEILVAVDIKDEKQSRSTKDICAHAKDLGINSQEAVGFSKAILKIKKYHRDNFPDFPSKIIICGSLYLAGQFLSENVPVLTKKLKKEQISLENVS